MQTSPAVFVIVTAKDCGACTFFKHKTQDDLMSKLESYSNSLGPGKLEIVSIDLDSISSAGQTLVKYHRDLIRYVSWFPTFLLFTKQSWHSDKLVGKAFNGEIQNGRWVPVPINRQPMTSDAILNWIKTTQNDPNFKPAAPKPLQPISSSSRRTIEGGARPSLIQNPQSVRPIESPLRSAPGVINPRSARIPPGQISGRTARIGPPRIKYGKLISETTEIRSG